MCLCECKDSEKYGYEQKKMTKKCTFWCFEVLWGIRGIFMGYSWSIHMYRLCVGYVSVMRRLCIGTTYCQGGLNEIKKHLR